MSIVTSTMCGNKNFRHDPVGRYPAMKTNDESQRHVPFCGNSWDELYCEWINAPNE